MSYSEIETQRFDRSLIHAKVRLSVCQFCEIECSLLVGDGMRGKPLLGSPALSGLLGGLPLFPLLLGELFGAGAEKLSVLQWQSGDGFNSQLDLADEV